MSATIHGIHSGRVVIEDEHGQGAIPVRIVRDMAYRATQRDAATASWAGRKWDRDTLNAAVDALDTLALAELPDCWVCFDGPAITTDLHDRPVCLPHAPDDDSGDTE